MSESNHLQDFGPRVQYDSSWTGIVPFERRQWKDPWFIPVFFIFTIGVFIWGVVMNNGKYAVQWGNYSSVSDNSGLGAQIAVSFGLGVGLLIIWLLVLRYLTKFAVYASLVTWSFVTIAIAIYGFTRGNIFVGVISLVFTCIVIMFIFSVRHKIPLAIIFLREATQCIFEHPSLTLGLVPLLFFCGAVAVGLMLWSVTWVYPALYSQNVDPNTGLGIAGIIVGFLALFWVHEAYMGIETFSFATVFAQWYVHRRTGGPRLYSVFGGLVLAVTKGFGTILFGALILAVIRMLRALARYGQRESSNGNGGILGFVLFLVFCCIRLILQCLEDIIRYINRYAMIYAAMYGDDFRGSARRVFNLFCRSDAQNFINDIIIGIVLSMGALVFPIVAGAIAYGITYATDKHDAWAGTLIGFIVAAVLFQHYGQLVLVAVDTLCVSYFEDCERAAFGVPLNCSPQWHATVLEYPACPNGVKEVPMPPPFGEPVHDPESGPPYSAHYGSVRQFADQGPQQGVPLNLQAGKPTSPPSANGAAQGPGYPIAPHGQGYPSAAYPPPPVGSPGYPPASR